ncbi:MAG: hypothetical protein JOZ62_06720, partial [Acidobacteriaceae bacterium]|nr:hypothetical protein [Acidobacteriaceae bacterium]
MLPTILVAESTGFAPEACEILRRAGNVCLEDLNAESLSERLKEADVLWVRLRNRIDGSILSRARRLKAIATPTTGLNHIDIEAAQSRGIEILSLRGEVDFLRDIRATAELTVGLALALIRRVPQAFDHVQRGGWQRDLFQGSELYRKIIGIVGYGRLGKIVADYFSAFGARVIAADPYIDAREVSRSVELVTLEELIRRADLVSIHVNLSAHTTRLFDEAKFAVMKRGAYLINTSRGEIVDERALLAALESGHLAGAGIDVIADEHNISTSPLVAYSRTHTNLLITPHIGGCTRESMEKTEVFLAHRV